MMTEAASPLLGSLKLRLARLRRLDDPRTSALATECEAMLQVIDRELEDLAAERRRR